MEKPRESSAREELRILPFANAKADHIAFWKAESSVLNTEPKQ